MTAYSRSSGCGRSPDIADGYMRTTDIAARVAQAAQRWGGVYAKQLLILCDDTGHWGHGVIDNLIVAGYGPIGLQYHGPALDIRYANRRAEMWMTGAEHIRAGRPVG